MNNAELYHKYHAHQQYDSIITLEHYRQKLKLNKKCKILEVGCGTGEFAFKYVLPIISKDSTIVGTDISKKMINFANTNFKHSQLSFEVLDITDNVIKLNLNFDLILSFYCLHWIQDQKISMTNIFNMLKPGGECLLLLIGNCTVYVLYKILAEKPRWKQYMKNYEDFIPPFQYSEDPLEEIQNLMNKIGFELKDCKVTETTYKYPSMDNFFNTFFAFCPFLDHIPRHMKKDYCADYKKIMIEHNLCTINANKEVSFNYSLITIHASKPI